MRRREFITLLGGAATWPLSARAQQAVLPVVALVSGRASDDSVVHGAAFRKGLSETSYVESQSGTVQVHWLGGQYNQLPTLLSDLIRQSVAVIAAAGAAAALAAKAATTTIPIVFGVGEDPVKLGLVASLERPVGNATGVNFLNQEIVAKELGLLHELLPRAVRIAVLVNPANASNAETTVRDLLEAARTLGLQIQELRASTKREIDGAFAVLMRQQADLLFIGGDAFLDSRRVQVASSALRYGIPTVFSTRESVAVGGFMSYGTDIPDMYRQLGNYAGRILKGARPADLPVVQSTKFPFIINMHTARLLGLEVPSALLAIADEV